MSSSPPRPVETPVRWGIRDAVVGVVLAVILVWLVATYALRIWPFAPDLRVALSYLAAWIPMLGAVLVATFLRGRRSLVRDFGLRFTWLDLVYGLILGVFLRSVATLFEVIGYGRAVGGQVTFGAVDYNLVWVLLALVAPILLAPFIEELFFRGLLQGAVLKASASPNGSVPRAGMVIAVAVSALVFAAVHMLQTNGGVPMAVVGATTLLVGIGVGTLAAVTGRLGGAIVAHVVFNGIGVVSGLL